MNYALESRVYEIARIDKKGIQDISPTSDPAMYQILSFELRFKGSMQNLLGFINKLHASPHFFIIRKINIESMKENFLSIELEIDKLNLNEDPSS
jgi:hypothetical protein